MPSGDEHPGAHYQGNFLWGHDDGSIEAIGYDLLNCHSENYRRARWFELLTKMTEEACRFLYSQQMFPLSVIQEAADHIQRLTTQEYVHGGLPVPPVTAKDLLLDLERRKRPLTAERMVWVTSYEGMGTEVRRYIHRTYDRAEMDTWIEEQKGSEGVMCAEPVELPASLAFHPYVEEFLEKLLTASHSVVPPGDPVYLVLQEGGSTGEMYCHTFNTSKDLDTYRKSAADASYATSGLVSVPPAIANHPGFSEFMEDLIRAFHDTEIYEEQ